MNTIMLMIAVVKATCYHATASQCNDDYLTTASGAKIESTDNAYQHRYIAVSRDLLESYPYGSYVTVSGCEVDEYNGVWKVADTMNKRITGTIDFLVNPGMKVTNGTVEIEKVNEP